MYRDFLIRDCRVTDIHEQAIDIIFEDTLFSAKDMTVLNVKGCNGLLILNYQPFIWWPHCHMLMLHAKPSKLAAGSVTSAEAIQFMSRPHVVPDGLRKTLAVQVEMIKTEKEVGNCRWTGPHIHLAVHIERFLIRGSQFKHGPFFGPNYYI